jgi:vacuolar-type H+-ATPase subunit I/STV1
MMDTLCVKRIPWSSALMTLLWFGVVVIGSLVFVVTYAWDGGFASLEGMLMGIGLVAGAVVVMAAGLVTVTMSYRLEHNRLMNVYEELRHAVEGPLRPIPEAPQP